MICRLCQRNESATGVCRQCMSAIGAVELPPTRRRPDPCVKCNGLRFVRVVPREYTHDSVSPYVAPMTLTQSPQFGDRILTAGKRVYTPDVTKGKGMLETYTCVGCGYVEWYCMEPSEIPIGPEYMSELVDHTPTAPFR